MALEATRRDPKAPKQDNPPPASVVAGAVAQRRWGPDAPVFPGTAAPAPAHPRHAYLAEPGAMLLPLKLNRAVADKTPRGGVPVPPHQGRLAARCSSRLTQPRLTPRASPSRATTHPHPRTRPGPRLRLPLRRPPPPLQWQR